MFFAFNSFWTASDGCAPLPSQSFTFCSSSSIVDGSRRKRIAGGSGTTVEEVNRLLDARKEMEKLMKGMSRGKMPDLGALTGGASAADVQPRRKATKSNKKKKRTKSRR